MIDNKNQRHLDKSNSKNRNTKELTITNNNSSRYTSNTKSKSKKKESFHKDETSQPKNKIPSDINISHITNQQTHNNELNPNIEPNAKIAQLNNEILNLKEKVADLNITNIHLRNQLNSTSNPNKAKPKLNLISSGSSTDCPPIIKDIPKQKQNQKTNQQIVYNPSKLTTITNKYEEAIYEKDADSNRYAE